MTVLRSKPKKNPTDIAMEDKIKTALMVNKASLGFDSRVKSCSIDYLDLTGTSYFANSDGTSIEQDKMNVWARVTASALSEGVFTYSREEIGSTAGYEIFDKQTPQELGEKAAKLAIDAVKR